MNGIFFFFLITARTNGPIFVLVSFSFIHHSISTKAKSFRLNSIWNTTVRVLLDRNAVAGLTKWYSERQKQQKTETFCTRETWMDVQVSIFSLSEFRRHTTVWPEAIQTYLRSAREKKNTHIYLYTSISLCAVMWMRNVFMRVGRTLHISDCDNDTHLVFFDFIFYALHGSSKCISRFFAEFFLFRRQGYRACVWSSSFAAHSQTYSIKARRKKWNSMQNLKWKISSRDSSTQMYSNANGYSHCSGHCRYAKRSHCKFIAIFLLQHCSVQHWANGKSTWHGRSSEYIFFVTLFPIIWWQSTGRMNVRKR